MTAVTEMLKVRTDAGTVTGFRRARLTGRDGLGLYPMPFTLRLWNLGDSDYHLLRASGAVSVMLGHALLASGMISDAIRKTDPEGSVTEVVFAAGLSLWEAPVAISVEAGISVSETVRRILEASGTEIRLLSFPGNDPVRARAQAFSGRAAECAEEALSAAGAGGYLTEAGLCVVPASGLPVSMELSSADLREDPVFIGDRLMLLRTRTAGWLPGKMIRVKWKDGSASGLVLERFVYGDTLEGKWQCELLAEREI